MDKASLQTWIPEWLAPWIPSWAFYIVVILFMVWALLSALGNLQTAANVTRSLPGWVRSTMRPPLWLLGILAVLGIGLILRQTPNVSLGAGLVLVSGIFLYGIYAARNLGRPNAPIATRDRMAANTAGWRRISDAAVQELTNKVRAIGVEGKIFMHRCSDPECGQYADRINLIFEKAGWHTWPPLVPTKEMEQRLPQDGGLSINAGDNLVYRVKEIFESQGLAVVSEVQGAPGAPPDNAVLIFVGPNPELSKVPR